MRQFKDPLGGYGDKRQRNAISAGIQQAAVCDDSAEMK
jgi:hypothetical protein